MFSSAVARRRLLALAGGLAGGVHLATSDQQCASAFASAPQEPTLHKRWEDGWNAGRYSNAGTGFHKADVNPHLKKFQSLLLGSASGSRVLVPLCGKSVDLVHLAEHGCDVVGVEGVSRALDEFAAEQQFTAQSAVVGPFTVRSFHPRIKICHGDFFKLVQSVAGEFDAVWDRASLVAIDPSTRQQCA